ncbi:hypothetical protein ACIHEJ_39165 [Streptomyces sp. NPDC052301]|uniref:hypothetical protein n=1 Tax=Streptomyces sp. NPDC052301 TaxID=3365687 RepID=UPI0037D8307D
MFVVLAALLERFLSVTGGPQTYVLCDDVVGLSERLDRETGTSRWLLLAGLVLSVAALVLSRVRRWRIFPVLALSAVVVLVISADGYAARADAVAAQISASQTCDEPTTVYDTSRGWFDWSPLGP